MNHQPLSPVQTKGTQNGTVRRQRSVTVKQGPLPLVAAAEPHAMPETKPSPLPEADLTPIVIHLVTPPAPVATEAPATEETVLSESNYQMIVWLFENAAFRWAASLFLLAIFILCCFGMIWIAQHFAITVR